MNLEPLNTFSTERLKEIVSYCSRIIANRQIALSVQKRTEAVPEPISTPPPTSPEDDDGLPPW